MAHVGTGQAHVGWLRAHVAWTESAATKPVAVNDIYTGYRNVTLNVAAPGVLLNDTPAGATIASYTAPGFGAVTLNGDGSLTYTPNDGFMGSDSFTYTLTNSAGSSTATVTISVVPPVTTKFLAGGASYLRKSFTDLGVTWATLSTTHNFAAMDVSPGIVMLGVHDSLHASIWKSTDQGATQVQKYVETLGANRCNGICWCGGNTWLACYYVTIVTVGTYIGEIVKSTDAGETWAVQAALPARNIVYCGGGVAVAIGVTGSSPNYVRTIWRSTDSGATWTVVWTGAALNLVYDWQRELVYIGGGVCIAFDKTSASVGRFLRSTDSGATWTAGQTFNRVDSIAYAGGNTVLAADYALNQLLQSLDGGLTWNVRATLNVPQAIWCFGGGICVAAPRGNGTNWQRSADNGLTWAPIAQNTGGARCFAGIL